MDQNTDDIRRRRQPERELDAMDRKILGVLVEDATISYADLGDRVGLSPPAAHERVKRLRRSGAIRRVSAMIDPEAVGKTLLAFEEHPEVEEIHSVTGDTCMLLKVRTDSTHALEGLLARLYDTPGVKATRSYVVLSTLIERPVQPGITKEWPPIVRPEGDDSIFAGNRR
jgi:Lrp/AsnC family transcriptional regulator, leucine-responsive regulatory protein